ncbi:MAG: BrnT family toxin [Candidatus Poribacteria bacterium]|nr:BrnT family toxin [Candidatus Poribacteria bacterium]
MSFSRAAKIFDGPRLEKEDTRRDCGEKRMLALGRSEGRILRVVYTRRNACIHIISSRKANTYERAEYIRRIQSF